MGLRSSRPRAATFVEMVIMTSMLLVVGAMAISVLVSGTEPPPSSGGSGASVPHATGPSLLFLVIPALIVVLFATTLWIRWHFRRHARRNSPAPSTSYDSSSLVSDAQIHQAILLVSTPSANQNPDPAPPNRQRYWTGSEWRDAPSADSIAN